MVTRTRVLRSVKPPPAAPAPAPAEALPPELDTPEDLPPMADGLDSLMAELAGATQAMITVYRIVKNQPPAYVFRCTPDSFSMDDLRDRHGGGEFRLYIVRDGGFFRNIRVHVESAKTIPGELPAIAEMKAMLAAQAKELQEFRMRNLSGAPTPDHGLFRGADLPAIITAVTGALVALRPPPAPPVAAPAPDMAFKAIEMFMKGVEMARDLQGGNGDGDGMMGVVRDLIKSPLVTDVVRAQMAPPPQPQSRRPAEVSHAKLSPPPAPTPAEPTRPPEPPGPPAPPPPPQNGLDKLRPALARFLPMLVAKARAGSEAGLYAALIVENVPENIIRETLEFQTAYIVEYMASIRPDVMSESPWFTALVEEIRIQMESADPPDDDNDGLIGPDAG